MVPVLRVGADPSGSGSKGKEFEQLIAGALDFANDLQFEGGGCPEAEAKGWNPKRADPEVFLSKHVYINS